MRKLGSCTGQTSQPCSSTNRQCLQRVQHTLYSGTAKYHTYCCERYYCTAQASLNIIVQTVQEHKQGRGDWLVGHALKKIGDG